MSEFYAWLVSSQGFMPHGHCYLWQPGTLWLNVGSDALIATAYFAIPVSLYSLVRRRLTDIPFPTVFLMFAAFILLCGLTHVMEIWTVWNPAYRLSGALKLLTGIVSLATTVTLFRLIPLALQLRSPQALQQEVALRTAELASANMELRRNVAELERQREEIKATNREKNESLALLATTLRSVGDAVISTDASGAVRFMNAVAEHLTGWTIDKAYGRPLHEVFCIINERTRESVESPVTKVLSAGSIVGLGNHTVLIAHDGSERAIEDSGAPVVEDGNLLGVVLVFRDATKERAAQHALLRSEQRFRSAVNAMQGVLWTNTAEGEMRGEQPGWAALTGQTFDQYQGFGWAQAVHPDDSQATIDAWNGAVAQRQRFEFEHRVRRHDGEWRTFLIRAIPTMSESGDILEWVGVHTDVTELRALEKTQGALLDAERAARSATERANQVKEEFLATLSHELRTPLAVAAGWGRVLLQKHGNSNEELTKGLRVIVNSTMTQSQIISDLLDISSITSGKLVLNLQPVELNGFVSQCVESHQIAASQKHIALQFEQAGEPKVVLGDAARLQQVMGNLLSNALKFTPAGGSVTAKIARVGATFEISVHDTGEGIDAEFLPYLFERFRQADGSRARNHGGMGLGLAIVKQLVQLHGGGVRANSAGPGSGTCISVSLPMASGTLELVDDAARSGLWKAGGPGPAIGALNGICALVVEDEPMMRDLIGRLLEEYGARVVTADTAIAALRALTADSGQQFGILISDIGLPGLDGYELVRQVRNDLKMSAERLPAIALTAFIREQDRDLALAVGFQAHLAKPIEASALVKIVGELAR